MMIPEPRCFTRRCKFFRGVWKIDENPDSPQVPVCTAFPQEIPREIAYGRNNHMKPFPGDHGIQYERKE